MTINKEIYYGNCRGGGREKSNGVLNHVFIKYVIDQRKFLREGIEVKNKIIDHLFTLKSSLRDEQYFSYKNVQIKSSSNQVDNETVFHNYSRQEGIWNSQVRKPNYLL